LRIALGAPVAAVFRLIVTHALILTGTGLVIGIGVAVLLTRAMNSLLYGVDALDPATYAGVAAILCLVALTACSVPALRAARMDPMKALRQS
jgi:putative ABC transport system permease protein